MGIYQLDSSNYQRTCLPVTLEWPRKGPEDVGASRLRAVAWDKQPEPLKMRISGNHQEENLPPDYRHPAFSGCAGPPVDGEAQAAGGLEWDPSCSSRCLQKKAPRPQWFTPQREEPPTW